MIIAVNQASRIAEVRVLTHGHGDAYVVIIMTNGTQSTLDEPFPNETEAEQFAKGLRSGLQWQARCIAAGVRAAGKFQEDYAMQPLEAEDFAQMIERDYIQTSQPTTSTD